jgi:hypothetical protein
MDAMNKKLDPKKSAEDYIRLNKLDYLLKEMINSTLSTNSEDPFISMISYLSENITDKDLEANGIKLDRKLLPSVNTKPLIKDFYFNDNSTLIIKRFLNPNLFDKLKNVKTKLGGTLSHLIEIANKIEGKETVGIFNTDGDCYSKMGLLINPALEFLHQYDQEKSLLNANYDLNLFKNGFSMSEISEYFFGFKLRINRNLSDHPYNPHCSKEARNAMKIKILKELEIIYPKGKFYELFDNDQSENNEKFNYLREIFFDKELNLLSSLCK